MGFGRPAICASSVEPFSVERGSPRRLASSARVRWMRVAHGDPPERLAAVRLDDASRRGCGFAKQGGDAGECRGGDRYDCCAGRVCECALRRGAEMTVSDCSSGLDRMRSTNSQSATAYVAQCRRCAASQAVCHLLNSPSSRIEIIQRDRTQLSDGRLDRRSVRLTLMSLRMGSVRGECEHSPTHRRPRGRDRGRPARRASRPARPRSGARCVPARR